MVAGAILAILTHVVPLCEKGHNLQAPFNPSK